MTLVLVTAVAGSGFKGSEHRSAERGDEERVPGLGKSVLVSSSERCLSARMGLAFYRVKYAQHRRARGLETPYPAGRKPRNCADARYLAKVWTTRAFQARRATERWRLARRTLVAHNTWLEAVREAQKAYPGTEGWLISCSASEGAHGPWVPNREGSGVGGWLQFYPSTFWRMWGAARADVTARGFRVPSSAASWYSPLGQALAGAWGVTNGRRHEWHGSGC